MAKTKQHRVGLGNGMALFLTERLDVLDISAAAADAKDEVSLLATLRADGVLVGPCDGDTLASLVLGLGRGGRTARPNRKALTAAYWGWLDGSMEGRSQQIDALLELLTDAQLKEFVEARVGEADDG